MTSRKALCRQIAFVTLFMAGSLAIAAESELEEVVVWGQQGRDTSFLHPSTFLAQEDFSAINVTTTEDLVKFEPSLVVRRRFIGDANGTLGIRGSNMFQTSRSMVFADGVPLHYLLESRWNGAPRWSMVSSSEIATVDVLYGPFSAEYSGNSMGGVIVIETAIPQQREFHFDSAVFSQDFAAYGFDDVVSGHKTFLSFGDKTGDLSYYVSYNRLDNESQPQSFYYGSQSAAPTPSTVTGAIPGLDDIGNSQLYFGDSGVEDTSTNNFKAKLGYDFGNWSALANVSYENRLAHGDARNSYLVDAGGETVWSGHVSQNGVRFFVPPGSLGIRTAERNSLSVALRMRGQLTETVSLESNLNRFAVLRDEAISSAHNPADPAHTLAGQITDYGSTGWKASEIKLNFAEIGRDMRLSTGLRLEGYELNINVYNSENYPTGSKDSISSRSGGETGIAAVFGQLYWDMNERWDIALGARMEFWESEGGYYSEDDPVTAILETIEAPSQSQDQFSPKFSIGLFPGDAWTLRYSLAKAYRFPIVEELFSQYQAYNTVNHANPALLPENGLHHNLLIERSLDQGYMRVNLYRENIENVIVSQATILSGGTSVRTFIPIDEVETHGAEFIANVNDWLIDGLDIRFNIAYTRATIIRNLVDPTIEGNTYPRMPKWRGNLLATYHINEDWELGGGLQYAGYSFGRLDNTDTARKVFNAQDETVRLGLKSTWRFSQGMALALGVDNVLNEVAYVAHPWPGRTFYMNFSYDY